MAKPNFIPGMKLKGIARKSPAKHLLKKAKTFAEFNAKVKRDTKRAKYEPS